MIPLGVLSAMAPKMQFAMKSPKSVMKGAVKAKAKGKAKATPKATPKSDPEKKVKREPTKTPEKKPSEENAEEISRQDQQHFSTFLARSDDPRAESLRVLYQGMARNDPKKRELVSQWKLDKTLSWHVHHEEVHSTGKSQEQSQTVGWMTRWNLFLSTDVLGGREGGRTHNVE